MMTPAIATRKEDIAAAEAANAGARAKAEFWKHEWERVGTLSAFSLSERERARAQFDAAVQDEQATKALWEKAVAGFRKEEIQEAQTQARQQTVNIVPLTPDDPLPDLEELDRVSAAAMAEIEGGHESVPVGHEPPVCLSRPASSAGA